MFEGWKALHNFHSPLLNSHELPILSRLSSVFSRHAESSGLTIQKKPGPSFVVKMGGIPTQQLFDVLCLSIQTCLPWRNQCILSAPVPVSHLLVRWGRWRYGLRNCRFSTRSGGLGARIVAIWNTTKLHQINLKYHYCQYCISKMSKWYNMRNFENTHTSTTPRCKPYIFSGRNLQDQKMITTSQRWLCRETRIMPKSRANYSAKKSQVNHCCLGPALFVAHLIAQPTSRPAQQFNDGNTGDSRDCAETDETGRGC